MTPLERAAHTLFCRRYPKSDRELCRGDANAVITEYLAAMREAGWKLTQREPTDEMIESGAAYDGIEGMGITGEETIGAWRAAWDAAPEPPDVTSAKADTQDIQKASD